MKGLCYFHYFTKKKKEIQQNIDSKIQNQSQLDQRIFIRPGGLKCSPLENVKHMDIGNKMFYRKTFHGMY